MVLRSWSGLGAILYRCQVQKPPSQRLSATNGRRAGKHGRVDTESSRRANGGVGGERILDSSQVPSLYIQSQEYACIYIVLSQQYRCIYNGIHSRSAPFPSSPSLLPSVFGISSPRPQITSPSSLPSKASQSQAPMGKELNLGRSIGGSTGEDTEWRLRRAAVARHSIKDAQDAQNSTRTIFLGLRPAKRAPCCLN